MFTHLSILTCVPTEGTFSLILNTPQLVDSRAFVKMSVVNRFVQMCCKSTSPTRTYSWMKW